MNGVKKIPYCEDKLCNKCGGTVFLKKEGTKVSSGLMDATVLFNYDDADSEAFFEDGDKYRFSLCSKCLSDLFQSFALPVEKRNHLDGEDGFESYLYYEKDLTPEEQAEFEGEYLEGLISGAAFKQTTDDELVNSFLWEYAFPNNRFIFDEMKRRNIVTKENVDDLFNYYVDSTNKGYGELLVNKTNLSFKSQDVFETKECLIQLKRYVLSYQEGVVSNYNYVFILNKSKNMYIPYDECSDYELGIIKDFISTDNNLKKNFDDMYLGGINKNIN